MASKISRDGMLYRAFTFWRRATTKSSVGITMSALSVSHVDHRKTVYLSVGSTPRMNSRKFSFICETNWSALA